MSNAAYHFYADNTVIVVCSLLYMHLSCHSLLLMLSRPACETQVGFKLSPGRVPGNRWQSLEWSEHFPSLFSNGLGSELYPFSLCFYLFLTIAVFIVLYL